MTELIAVALITILATISPGPDFAMVTRNSYLYGRKAGMLAALGIALAVQLHVFYTMFGVGVLLAHSPALFTIIKMSGAIYLIYIGWKTIANKTPLKIVLDGAESTSVLKLVGMGFLTNALNPKTTLFVVSTYTQVVHATTPWSVQFGYGLFMSAADLVWFAMVAIFFSRSAFRARLVDYQGAIDKFIGSVLMGLGFSLAMTNMVSR